MEVGHSSPVVLDASIRNIKFGLATAEEIRTYSINDSPVSHPSQLTNPFLGLPLESGKCESCGTAEHGECEGHFGYIPLITPVYHPCHISELRNILSLVCLKCMRMKKGKLKNSLGKEKVSSTSCFYCRDLPAISIMEVKTTDGAFCLELKVPSRTRYKDRLWNFMDKFGFHYGGTSCRPLLPYEALRILIEIPEETKRKLAGKGFFPQDGFIMQSLPVPPNCLYVPEISDGKSIMSSDISVSLLKKVLSKNELIKRSRSGVPNFESHEIESNDLQSSITQYLHLRGTTKAPLDIQNKLLSGNDVAQLSGKRWLEKMKTLFISKGSGFCSRSVICGDAYIGVNVIGLPIEIAKKITFEERVTKYNITRLQEIVDNRLCITYRDGLSTYAIAVGSKGHTYLKVGQIINRRIMDGDIVFINRPPSTHKHSLQAFSIFIHEDHTVKINPLVCAPFGADFDGDCIHIFYPQSLAAKAEVRELFSVEKQLLSSHSGNLNLPLVHDSLLSLKLLFNRTFLSKATAQQLAMFVSPVLPPPAVLKAHDGGPFWTVVQILQSALPASFDSVGMRHLIRNSEILKLDPNKDMLQSVFIDIATSIIVDKSPQEALQFLDQLQPLLMETLFLEGYSLDLRDFEVPKDMIENLWKNAQEISGVLDQLRWAYNDLVDKQVEDHIKNIKLPIVSFIIKLSALGGLVDSKSDSAIQKVVEQIGLLGIQISDRGKLYSKALVEDLFIHYVSKYSADKVDNPSEAYGLIKNSFFHGLNPFEEMIHSIASREVIVRSSRGLTEPGTLFKNLMAILRDVSICYDGTVRNVCSNSIVQFEYGVSPAGEPVGVLAATAISNPAYKAVLDSSRSTNSSWELMKEILLCKVNFKNDPIDRRVMLYLKDCHCGKKFCKENAAVLVQNCLRRVTLKECAVDFSIEYQKQIVLPGNSEAVSGLVGHIHLDQMRLNALNRSIDAILRKCQDVMFSYGKKKGQLAYFYRKITLSTCECCSFQQPNHGASPQFPCLQFSICDASPDIIPLERTIHVMVDAIFPILLDTIVKGDPRVHAANIVWVGPDTYAWVRNSSASLKGELAIEVDIEKDVVRRNGDAWRIVLDACLPVMHLIDSRRSIPYGIQQIQEFLGISSAFDQSVQRLSTSIKMVAKGVLKEHLILVANNMTCTGCLIGFSTGGYKALFRSLKVQVPFTEATLYTPMKCFERAAEKLHTDSLASIVSSCSWGKHVAIGTGTPFQLIWDKEQMANNQDCGEDVYDFLELVRATPCEVEATSACLGADVDNLAAEDEGNEACFSPEPIFDSEEPIFDDVAELEPKWGVNGKMNNGEISKSSWDNGIGATSKSDISDKANAWGSWKLKNAEPESSWTKKSNDPNCWSENVMKVRADGSEKLQIWNGNASLNLKSQPSNDFPSKSDTWGNQQPNNVHDLTSLEGVSHNKYKMDEWGKDSIQDGWGFAKETAAEHAWDHHLTRKTGNVEGLEETSPSASKMNIWEGEGSAKASFPTSLHSSIWKENKANNDKKRAWNSRGWGSSQVADHKMQKNHPTRLPASLDDRKSWNANRTFTSTGRRSDFFTCEEEKILVEVEPIMQTIRKILRESSDGDRISSDDQKFVIENVFKHHPDKQAKVTDEIDYIMVDKHKNFQESRCFYVVSTDGSSADFSYIKCMENYVKETFPEHGETFNRKYFPRRRSEQQQ